MKYFLCALFMMRIIGAYSQDIDTVSVKVLRMDSNCRYVVIKGSVEKVKRITIVSPRFTCLRKSSNTDSVKITVGKTYKFYLSKTNSIEECNGKTLLLRGSFLYEGKRLLRYGEILYKSNNSCRSYLY
jgi:hypothetical protein